MCGTNEATQTAAGLHVNCEDCLQCPKCRNLISDENLIRSNTAVKDLKLGSSRGSSSKRSNTARSGENKENPKEPERKCPEDPSDENKLPEDRLVKWFPDHISKDPAVHPLIPYPHPAMNVELRGGVLAHICYCLRRNGLQSDCPYSGCKGKPECMQQFLPGCIPSGLALPPKRPAFLQKADDPECYSKTELVKGHDKVMRETRTGGTGGIEGGVVKPAGDSQSDISLISPAHEDTEKKAVIIRPNSPPNYMSDPPVENFEVICRRHRMHDIPGSGEYMKYERCRLKHGQSLPKVIVPRRKKDS